MKKIFSLTLLLVLPAVVLAAYDDVSLTGVDLTVGSFALQVSGGTAQINSITVDSSSFSVTLNPGSSIRIVSTDKYTLSHNAAVQYVNSSTCEADQSTLVFSDPVGDSASSVTITVTPSSTTCSGGSASSPSGSTGIVTQGSSGSGGGGGSGSYTPPTTPVVAPSLPPTASPVAVFVRGLALGSRGADVKALQTLLHAQGVYPQNVISGYFGLMTRAAVRQFQVKYGIVHSGVAGYGTVGPKTRAKLNSLSQ